MSELLWDGKYREGRRVLPDRTPRPLITGEIANPPGSATGETIPGDGWRNRLIHGETRDVLPALLPEFAGRINLVYMDPPFATGADQTITIPLPRAGPDGLPPPSIERVAYRDSWGAGLDGYLHWFYETATLLRELLAEDGAIIVHCDWRADAHLRLILDEIFGAANFRNAIAWAYRSGGASQRKSLARKHDTLLLYARSPRFAIRPQIERQYLRRPFIGSRRDAAGRHYVDTLLRDVLDGEVTLVREGQLVRRNLRPVLNVSRERLGYPTQKPLGLIELLIEIASDSGDLVLDCCCGSGTTPAAAATTGRRWIAADSGPFALAATRARLLALPAARPFAVQRVAVSEHDAGIVAENKARVLHVTAHIARRESSPPGPLSPRGEEMTEESRRSRSAREDRVEEHPMGQVVSVHCCSQIPGPLSSASFASSAVPLSSPSASVTLTVDGLTLPPGDLPIGALPPDVASGCAWIACWLVDWEHNGKVFYVNDWAARPRGIASAAPAPALTHTYTRLGRHTIAVRAIDLLGGVTTATLEVDL